MDEFQLLATRDTTPKISATGCEAGVQRCLSYYGTDIKAVDETLSTPELLRCVPPTYRNIVLLGEHVVAYVGQNAILAE